ncbi:MAG TPA: TonB-dependent receptor [Vicinamibacterales bacterium]|nr:TonB-dependent receptor [Vicinamibacterales bacterium]
MLTALLPIPATAQTSAPAATGRIEGSVRTEAGAGIADAVIVLEPARRIAVSDQNGVFVIDDVPAGAHTIRINVGEFEARDKAITVVAGQTLRVDRVLPRDFAVVMTVTVTGASRSPEMVAEAPAPTTVVTAAQAALEGGSGQLPALFQFAPGAEYVQSGLYNMEFNVRGFNTALSRRIQVLIDGRDAAAPESKNQEWLNVGFLAGEIERAELVRGPGAALYGANSINGVMLIETKTPRATPGGRARVTTGDLDTFMADGRWAGAIGSDWYLRVLGDVTRSGSFSQSRVTSVEYEGLPTEVVPALVDTTAVAGSVRADRYTGRGHQLILEGSFTRGEGGTYLTQAGRLSIENSTRSWGRAGYRTANWQASVHLDTRYADQIALYAPVGFPTATVLMRGEFQGSRLFAGDRGRVMGGMAFLTEHVDSADDSGRQTLYQKALRTNAPGVFGQVDFDLATGLKVVGALRFDDSTLHDTQWSPRVAVVYTPSPHHSFRAAANRGFQVGNYTELFLNVPAAPPVDLSAIEAALAPVLNGVPLGLESVPIFAIGNSGLDVEKITSFEVGYAATYSRGRVSIDVYRNRMRDFISDLLFGVNPAYPPYQAPAALPPASREIVEATLNGLVPGLTNAANGAAEIVLSNNNVGEVRSRGVELGLAGRPHPSLTVEGTYTWFDFTPVDPVPGLEPKANTPTHRGSIGVTYTHPRLTASFRHRWVGAFRWASGVFDGPVPSYQVSDLNLAVPVTRQLDAGANIANLFDQDHYEMFGGDLLGRRALVHLTVHW